MRVFCWRGWRVRTWIRPCGPSACWKIVELRWAVFFLGGGAKIAFGCAALANERTPKPTYTRRPRRNHPPPQPSSTAAMPRQNRVTPFNELIATPARGALMGNRGILHNDRAEK